MEADGMVERGGRGAWHGMAHSRRPVKVNWANVARQRVINHFFVVAFLCVWNLLVYKTEIQMRQPAACQLRPWTALSRLCIVFTAFSPVNLLPSLSVSLRSVCLPKWRHVSGSNWRVANAHTTYTHSPTPHTHLHTHSHFKLSTFLWRFGIYAKLSSALECQQSASLSRSTQEKGAE